jgi:hypothetical protein
MSLKFFVNAEELASELKAFKAEAEKAIEEGVKKLSLMTHAKITELANENLGQTRKIYLDNLSYDEVVPGLWVVSLDEKAMWIEDGRKSGSMVDDLLKNSPNVAKDGSRYKAIPFDHAKAPSQQTPFARSMTNLVKNELKKKGIPFKKLEFTHTGSPRLGLLHQMNVESPRPSARASHPALAALSVYQTRTSTGAVRRDILTFRMVSDKHKSQDKWVHPGREASNFFEEALRWAENEFETTILPQIMSDFDKK